MRILHFLIGRCNPDSANGVDKTVYYLSQAQAKLGNDVAVLSLTGKSPIPVPGVCIKNYSPKLWPFGLPKKLVRDLLEWKPNIVHFHSVYIPSNAVLGYLLRKYEIPYIVTPHGGLAENITQKNWWVKIPYKFVFELPLLNNSKFVHAVGDPNDAKKYGVKTPILTIPNGLDLSIIPDSCNKNLLASQHIEVRGKRVFLFMGRLDITHKGLDILLEGFAAADIPNTVLIIVGPDKNGSLHTLEKLVKKLELDSKVIFVGPLYGKAKFDYLSGTDVFVHTSRWEGLSFAVLEAFASAKPCLLTPVADPLRMTQKYNAGIVVKPDTDSIAEGFQAFSKLENIELNEMGKNGLFMIEKEFSWLKIANDMTVAYTKYINGDVANSSVFENIQIII